MAEPRNTLDVPAPREQALLPGPDGRPRCWWSVVTPDYVAYHDLEWGRPVLDERLLFEHLCLEVFQAGLSWLTVLRRREAFRQAFAGFDPERVARFGERDIARLLADGAIIRNRTKIEAVIGNARGCLDLAAGPGSLGALMWSYAPEVASAPRSRRAVPATSPEAAALASDLKRRGFRFVGPTTLYAHMQACGMVNDHIAGCLAREPALDQRRRQEAAIRSLASRGPGRDRHHAVKEETR